MFKEFHNEVLETGCIPLQLLEHKIDSFQQITLQVDGGINTAELQNSNTTETYNISDNLENTGSKNFRTTADNYDLNSNFLYKRRFPKKGRSFVADFSFDKANYGDFSILNSTNSFLLNDPNSTFSEIIK